MVSGLVATCAAASSRSPAGLAGAQYAAAEAVLRAADGDSRRAPPVSVAFPSPGQVEFAEGEEVRRCSFTAEGGGYLWSLELSCDGERLRREWTWLPSGSVWTDLVDVPGGELMLLDPRVELALEPAVARFEPPVSYASSAPTFASLAGRWADRAGALFEVGADGAITMSGHRAEATLLSCVHIQVKPHPVVPCVRFADADGKARAFALLADFAWVEGVIRPGEDGAPLRYEGWRGGPFFGRVQPAPAAPQKNR